MVTPASTRIFRQATRMDLPDFEDAMQVAAAIACGADVIATRHVRDHAKAPVPAETPTRVLERLDDGARS